MKIINTFNANPVTWQATILPFLLTDVIHVNRILQHRCWSLKESNYAMHLNFCFTSFFLSFFLFPFPFPRQEVQNLLFIEKWLPQQVKIPVRGHGSKWVNRKCMKKSNLSIWARRLKELTLNNKIFTSAFQYHGRKFMKNSTNLKKRQDRRQHVKEQLNGK